MWYFDEWFSNIVKCWCHIGQLSVFNILKKWQPMMSLMPDGIVIKVGENSAPSDSEGRALSASVVKVRHRSRIWNSPTPSDRNFVTSGSWPATTAPGKQVHICSTWWSFRIKTRLLYAHRTWFENHWKCLTWSLQFWHFHQFLSYYKSDLSGNTVWPQASGFQNWPFWAFFNAFWPLIM